LKPRIALVAVDAGPRHVMHALLEPCVTEIINQTQNEEICISKKIQEFLLSSFDIWVVGTSGSEYGKKIEAITRRSVVKHNKPLIVIEDFPGNFKYIEDGQPDLLIVEHDCICEHYKQQLGKNCPSMAVFPNPRYDHLRKQYFQNNLTFPTQNHSSSILWAGQPETKDAMIVLSRLIPTLSSFGLKLLFSAHPRDSGYAAEYIKLFEQHNITWRDVTGLGFEKCRHQYQPKAVITQYSSVAIEAGFYGIPSVNVLYDDVGAKRLLRDKSYSVPPWCLFGASMIIQSTQDQSCIINKLVHDSECRFNIKKHFEEFWGLTPSTHIVLDCIKKV
jgi:hypothetical protein